MSLRSESAGKVVLQRERIELRELVRRTAEDYARLLPRLFQPFTQAELPLDRKRGGLGLGLALVRGLVEMHGERSALKARGGTVAQPSLLRLAGHEVTVALTGREGIAQARATRPDMVLCDIGLPEMDGYSVARTLRSDPELARVRMIAVTGYAGPGEVARALAAGFDGHLAKPPTLDAIERQLSDAEW